MMIGGSTQQRPSNNRSSLLSQSLQQQQQQFSQPQRTQDHPNPKSHPLSIDMSKLSHHHSHKHHRISPTSPINNKPTVITSSSSSDNSGHINTPTSTSSTSTIPTTISTNTSTNTSISNVGSGSTKPYQIPDFFGIVESDVYRCSLPTKSDHFAFLETLQLRTIIFLSQEMNEKSLVSFCDRNRIQLINLGTSLIQYPSVNSTNCWNFDLGTSSSSSSSSSSCSFVGRSNNFNMNNHHNNNSSSTNSTIATTSTSNNREKATTTTTATATTKQQIDHTDEYHTINVSCTSWKHCSEKLVKETLELLLDRRNHPILVMCSSGIHLTGTVIGCLRRLQCWALSSILDEYDSFAHARSRYADRQFIELFDTDLICLPSSAPTSFSSSSSSSSLTTTFGQEHNDADDEEHNGDNGVNDDENEPIVPEWFMVQRELMQYEVQYMNRNRVPVKSSQVPALTKEDSRLAFEEYWFCRDAPLISAKSTFSKHSVIEEEDD